MKRLGRITIQGASGASYEFNVHPWESAFTAEGAVYVVTKRREKKGGRHAHSRLLAGQAADLSERVAEHRLAPALKGRNANCVCVLAEPAESERIRIESDLLSRYRPPCNAAPESPEPPAT